MTKIVDLTEQQLTSMVSNKAQFEKLHVGGTLWSGPLPLKDTANFIQGLVKKNMGKTSGASIKLEKIMLEKTPANLKPEAEKLSARREAAFSKAISAFANSQGGEDQADGEDDSE